MRIKKDFFLIPYIGLLIVLLQIQLQFSQLGISLWINSYHNSLSDFLCLYGTYLGDGWVWVLACIALYYFCPRLAITMLVSYLISAGITQGLKEYFFQDWQRPLWHIRENGISNFHFVEGAERNLRFSFPSGHSTTAFAVFSTLALFAEKSWQKQLFFFIALFTAFTRIYLLQHFLMDAFAGSLIGTLTAYCVYYFLYKKNRLEVFCNWKKNQAK